MALYNLTKIAMNTTDPLGFVKGVNDIMMGGWMGTYILIALAIIIFTAFFQSTTSVRSSVMATSFIIFALSIMMRVTNLIGDYVVIVSLLICAIAVATTVKDS